MIIDSTHTHLSSMDYVDELIVEQVGVLTTYFINASNGCGVYLRNAKISNAKIINLSRGDRITLLTQVSALASITSEQLESLKRKIQQKLANDPVLPLISYRSQMKSDAFR